MDNPAASPLPGEDQPSRHETSLFLTAAQLRAEVARCEHCAERPCLEACPCHCSPADFIRAVKVGLPSDYRRAAALIMSQNPLGGVCGLVCPDHHCLAACVHRRLDRAVNIPAVQATIIWRAKELGVMPAFRQGQPSGRRVTIIGSGPAGLAAAAVLAGKGHAVTILEQEAEPGGICRCIPGFRLDQEVLRSDIDWILSAGNIELLTGQAVDDPLSLLGQGGCDAVVVATGLQTTIFPSIPGEELALPGIELLQDPARCDLSGSVAVIGGGSVAFDCAMTARLRGASRVELFALEKLSEMPLGTREMEELVRSGIEVNGRLRVITIEGEPGRIRSLQTRRVRLREGAVRFDLADIEDVAGTEARRDDLDHVVLAIGLRSTFPRVEHPAVLYAGDCVEGPTTVVEAAAAGKNAAEAADVLLGAPDRVRPTFLRSARGRIKGRSPVPGYRPCPVPLHSEFFGRPILSPFLLSAAPPTDGLEQMRRAYEAGWAGGIIKTAFDGVPIHIPGQYMFAFDQQTYANCDNVSGHSLDRVCREVEELVRAHPDRLTMASTGGPVTGNDEADSRQWQSNTRKLESAGAMAIEYSLSCPQGGDGTEGDIVSQNAALTARIIDWILAGGDGQVPKLFKLTGAVTSVAAIVMAVREVLSRHPGKRAGITLANSFPTLALRPGSKKSWEEGIVVGASGAGILNISYLTLAKVAHLGVAVSGNGGPMDYKAAADFLALGARTVQLCTMVTRYGYGIIDDLTSGVSHLMQQRGLRSMADLIGAALPDPITDFLALSPEKKISRAERELCLRCGNCTRCPYLAVSLDESGFPVTDPSRCIGCGICSLKCFALALSMAQRTPEETAALRED